MPRRLRAQRNPPRCGPVQGMRPPRRPGGCLAAPAPRGWPRRRPVGGGPRGRAWRWLTRRRAAGCCCCGGCADPGAATGDAARPPAPPIYISALPLTRGRPAAPAPGGGDGAAAVEWRGGGPGVAPHRRRARSSRRPRSRRRRRRLPAGHLRRACVAAGSERRRQSAGLRPIPAHLLSSSPCCPHHVDASSSPRPRAAKSLPVRVAAVAVVGGAGAAAGAAVVRTRRGAAPKALHNALVGDAQPLDSLPAKARPHERAASPPRG